MKTLENTLINHNTVANDYEVRNEEMDGRKYMVVPVVMMVEGVHSGSGGAIFHSSEELGRVPGAWNGIPIVINHPQEGESFISANSPDQLPTTVGRVYNTKMEDGKLKAEAWLDVDKLGTLSDVAMQHILNRDPLDVSVGVFTDNEPISGQWENESYISIAHNHRPDHLALLPGGVGACSWRDGCGIRVNSKQKGGQMEDLFQTLKEVNQKGYSVSLISNEEGYQAIMSKIQALLNSLDNDETSYYLVDLYDSYFVYEVYKRNGGSGTNKIYKRGYMLNDASVVEFDDNPVEVRREVNYIALEMRRNKSNINVNKGGIEMTECCKKKVDALIANTLTAFTEDDREWLQSLEEAKIDRLVPKEPKVIEVNQEQALEVLSKTLKTPENYLDLMPEGMKAQFESGLALYNEKRTGIIEKIIANSEEGVWTKEELEAMEDSMLEKLSKTAKAEPAPGNYAAQGTRGNSSKKDEPEKLLPYGVEAK